MQISYKEPPFMHYIRYFIIILFFICSPSINTSLAAQNTATHDRDYKSNRAHSTNKDSINNKTICDITKLLKTITFAWNQHDEKPSMALYWHSSNLTCSVDNNDLIGYDKAMSFYHQAYGSSPEVMGKISYDWVKIHPLTKDLAAAEIMWIWNTKGYVLPVKFEDYLIFNHFPDGWHIVFERPVTILPKH
jgi:hypothetical protein